jgi:hypothetical protein
MNHTSNPKQDLVGTHLHCTQTNTLVTITEYAEDFWTGTERFEGFRLHYPNGMTHIISVDRVGKDYLLYSFVLADLFDVEPMTLDIPDFAYELDPSIGFTECPDCEGQGWVEVEGSAWFNRAWAFHTFSSMKRCEHCHGAGEVFESQQALKHDLTFTGLEPLPYLALAA